MMENKWTKKEQIKYKELDNEDQEELRDHAFDWCVEFTHEDKVIDILNKIGKAMKDFKGDKKDLELITYEASGYKGIYQIRIKKITEYEKNRITELVKKLNNIRRFKNGVDLKDV